LLIVYPLLELSSNIPDLSKAPFPLKLDQGFFLTSLRIWHTGSTHSKRRWVITAAGDSPNTLEFVQGAAAFRDTLQRQLGNSHLASVGFERPSRLRRIESHAFHACQGLRGLMSPFQLRFLAVIVFLIAITWRALDLDPGLDFDPLNQKSLIIVTLSPSSRFRVPLARYRRNGFGLWATCD
jgi:hypothetical protein